MPVGGTIAAVGYKVLGFVVWQGGKWFARRKVNALISGRRLAAAGVVAVGIGGLAVAASRRQGG